MYLQSNCPLTQPLHQPHQIPVRILNNKLALTHLDIRRPVPGVLALEIQAVRKVGDHQFRDERVAFEHEVNSVSLNISSRV